MVSVFNETISELEKLKNEDPNSARFYAREYITSFNNGRIILPEINTLYKKSFAQTFFCIDKKYSEDKTNHFSDDSFIPANYEKTINELNSLIKYCKSLIGTSTN